MKKTLFPLLLLIGVLTSGSNCNSETVAPFLPDLSQNWFKVGDVDNRFFFINIASPGSNVSDFTGNNNNNGNFRTFTGKYNNRNIEFTIDGTTEKYQGTISTDSKQMNLNNGTVILKKG
mgnify:CR=1 FL=1